MYQKIDQAISVVGIYQNQHFFPKKFKWQARILPVDQVTLFNNLRDGIIKKRLYSVLSEGNLYRLEFNRDSEQWKILEIWVE